MISARLLSNNPSKTAQTSAMPSNQCLVHFCLSEPNAICMDVQCPSFCSSARPLLCRTRATLASSRQVGAAGAGSISVASESERVKWLQSRLVVVRRAEESRSEFRQLSQHPPSPPPVLFDACQQPARMQNKASVVIGLSGRNLKDLDLFSKSDPYVVISR